MEHWVQSYGIRNFAVRLRRREMMQNQARTFEKLHALRNEMRDMVAHGGHWDDFALRVFRFQAECNGPYGTFVKLRGVNPDHVESIEQIPFLPVEFFQTHRISVFPETLPNEKIFLSSGTSGQIRSQHVVDDSVWYDDMAEQGYKATLGSLDDTAFFGLLPGYLERGQSSLVHMVRNFMSRTGVKDPDQHFFLKDFAGLEGALMELKQEGNGTRKVCIIGVTHALLGWAERESAIASNWPNLQIRIVETGGMKGQGPERIRAEVHSLLAPLSTGGVTGSEYGMTEMLSQAWSKKNGRFESPPWLQIWIGSMSDPGDWLTSGRQGRIHVMDLTNLSSCSFLATGDLGRRFDDGSFEVLGRFDHAEVRGCNLMTVE